VCAVVFATPLCAAPALLEYPGHPGTYGDHTFTATWAGGPVPTVTVEYATDESVLHNDGNGQSQRTARNTLNFDAPSADTNPQNFDNLALVAQYGIRFPQLQQLAAAGTSTLTYRFPKDVDAGFDLFVNDLDSSDTTTIRAFGTAGAPLDMTTWTLAGVGDLSLYKNTGTEFSDIIAPTPTTVFSSGDIRLTAVDGTNYNRSYSILRAPIGTAVERVEIEFTGVHNSPDRDAGGNGSHVYLLLSTLPDEPDFDSDTDVDGHDFLTWQRGYDVAGTRAEGDANRDGFVDGDDLQAWQEQYGALLASGAATEAIPEPTGSVLMLTALFLVVRRRCARRDGVC